MRTLTRSSPGTTGFDATTPGTSEEEWAPALAAMQSWVPKRRSLLVVSPHPDDETLGAGGLIATLAKDGTRVTILSVTDGERSHRNWTTLRDVRRCELQNALFALGGDHIVLKRMGLPDGQVRHYGQVLSRTILDHLDDGATLVAPFEHDGHSDHDFVGSVCLEVARMADVPLARYPIWAWHHALPAHFPSGRARRFTLSEHAHRAKARAIRCFDSQLNPHLGTTVVARHVLKYFERRFETFLL